MSYNNGPDRSLLVFVGGSLLGAVAGALIAWAFAPPIGGPELWPYIRVFVALFGGSVGMTLTALFTAPVWMVIDR